MENRAVKPEAKSVLCCFFNSKVLLVDIGEDKPLPHNLQCESKPLIDLSNTPELNKIAPLKPIFSEQLKVSYIYVSWCTYARRKMSTGCIHWSCRVALQCCKI